MNYILDFIVHEAELASDVRELGTNVLMEFRADGLATGVVVPPLPASAKVKWDFPVRLILKLPEITSHYMFASLCLVTSTGGKSIARARIPLKALPVGSPKRFKFPLMHVANHAITRAQVTFTALISALVPYRFASYPPDRPPRPVMSSQSYGSTTW
jgi:hypothetical protein